MPSDKPPTLYIVKTGQTLPELHKQYGDFEDWIARGLEGRGLPVQVIDPRDGGEWPAPSRIAGVVITGSPAMVTDRAAWSERTAAWLSELVQAQTPVLGICYGHQLLAHALGGEVGHHPHGMEIGTALVERTKEAEEDPLLGALPPRFDAHVVHEQSVLRLPPDSVVLASNAHEPHQAFRVGRCAWGVQFHPEFSTEVMRGYFDLLEPRLSTPFVSETVRDTPEAAAILPRFAQWVQARLAGAEN